MASTTKVRKYLMALFGKERKPRSYPASKHPQVYQEAREWWLVEAPTANAARAVCALWPMRTTLPEQGARILNHSKKQR